MCSIVYPRANLVHALTHGKLIVTICVWLSHNMTEKDHNKFAIIFGQPHQQHVKLQPIVASV